MTLYKGLVPAQLGGTSSAVFDINSRTGRSDRWGGNVSIGLLSAKTSVEGPVVKDRVNLLFNARRSYADVFLKLTDDYRDNTLYFFDTNLKADWRISDRHHLYLSFFASRDRTAITDMVDIRWTNVAASLSWV